MNSVSTVVLSRDCDAVQIPAGNVVTIPAGTEVDITQTLGGSYTIHAMGGMLRSCYDPEIPVNIVDLGLVYDMGIEPLPSGTKKVFVKMTLTAPGCGMGATIAGDAQQKILTLPGVEDASVEIVWDPPWHQSMITAEGRRLLGLE